MSKKNHGNIILAAKGLIITLERIKFIRDVRLTISSINLFNVFVISSETHEMHLQI